MINAHTYSLKLTYAERITLMHLLLALSLELYPKYMFNNGNFIELHLQDAESISDRIY